MVDNFRFPEEGFDYATGGSKTKARKNIEAIQLLKTLEHGERQATPEEQQALVKYVGWGGIPQIFNPTPDPDWADLAHQLKDLLEPDEWNNAFESTLNAHYTSPQVIRDIYKGLDHLGFKDGRILEPSMGTGNFLGLMPKDMSDKSEIIGVELDSITGRIARQLYPEAEIFVQGFQDTSLPKDYFDLAISNVPFGDYKIHDPEYNHLDLRIHNYFIARSLDRVRPGGLVAILTSSGTMQARSSREFRAYLSERANLVGAMRLPGNTFKSNAGTEVTTDLLILQKLGSGIETTHEPWIDIADTTVQDTEGSPLQTNEYYVRHPERMLGTLKDDKLHPGRLALVADGRDLSQAMLTTFSQFPQQIYQRPVFREEPENTLRERLSPDTTLKNFGYIAQGEIIWQRRGDWRVPTNFKGKQAERIKGMLEIRDAVEDVFEVQIRGGLDDELERYLAQLHKVYDKFVAKHGRLLDTANTRVFNLDPDAQLILALEQKNKDTKEIEKTAVFSQRTVRPKEVRETAESSQEALVASLNEYNQVVLGYMAQLLGVDEDTILKDLIQQGLIFKDPTTAQWQTEDHYLSGGVREKLKIAQAAVEESPEYQINVEALQKVQPRDLGPGEIEVRLGSPWVPPEVITDFAHELLQVPREQGGITVVNNRHLAVWAVAATAPVKENPHNRTTYGTKDLSAIEMLQLSLNLKDATVYYKDSEDKLRVDQKATLSARMKQEQIKERFKGWVWQDYNRSEQLCKIYNDLFNGSVVREFRNPNLEMPGSSPSITLRPHQKDAVWRSLQTPTTLLAHEVGAGKTFTMVASAIEMRRLGIAKKPMIVVPNHMLSQFTNELQHLYPNAKLLAPGEKDTKASKRKELMARIATGDWDAVIVTHSAFTLLPISKEQEKAFYYKQLSEIESALGDRDIKQSNAIVKALARERRKLQARIESITKSERRDDGVVFDQLGIDALFVDEAHFWKNLGRASKLQNITGLSNTTSQRAMDAFMKCQLVRKQGGRLVFATGTPISNSIAEMYTMQRFLQPEALEQQGISHFDAWVGAFAEKVTAAEIDATGRFKVKTRLTKFTNIPELMTLFRETADIKTTAQLNLPVPEVERITVATQASQVQLQYMEHLIHRAENIASRQVEPDKDNMLWVTTDGRRSSLDMRLVSPDLPDHPQNKVNQAIANIHQTWERTAENRLTQMVFCDLGTPKKLKAGQTVPFNLYGEIKAGLIAKGIPSEQIAFIHDATNNNQKEELYAKVRNGEVRVLIGSTEKCGVGMNIQERLIAEHHLDAPWRPADIAQREGRIIRQGNRNSKVMVLTYVTQGRDGQIGFDSYSWQTLARKAEMVEQVMNGDPTLRSVDDISGAALSFDEIKAIATGNPLIMEKATVDNRVTELQRYQQAYLNDRFVAQQQIKHGIPREIDRLTQRTQGLEADIARRQDTRGDKFKIKIGNGTLSDRELAGQLILGIVHKVEQQDQTGTQKIGEYAGFDLVVCHQGLSPWLELRSESGLSHKVNGAETPTGVIRTLGNTLNSLPDQLESAQANLLRQQVKRDVVEKELDKPFEYETELEQLLTRQHEINTELGLYKNDEQAISQEGEAESQEESPDPSPDQDKGEEATLINLDDLASVDRGLDWLDGLDPLEQTDAVCEPTLEVIAALQNLGTFAPDPQEASQVVQVEMAELDEVIQGPSPPPQPDSSIEHQQPVNQGTDEQLTLFPETSNTAIEWAPQSGQQNPQITSQASVESIVLEADQVPRQHTLSQPQGSIDHDAEGLNLIQQWYQSATLLGAPPAYLERITEVAQDYQAGQMLSEIAISTMMRDLHQLDLYQNTSQEVAPKIARQLDPGVQFNGERVTVEEARSILSTTSTVLSQAGVKQPDGSVKFTGKQFDFHQGQDQSLLIIRSNNGKKVPLYYNGQFSNLATPKDKQAIMGIPHRFKQAMARAEHTKAQGKSRQQNPKPQPRKPRS
ncbi:MAG: DEAD/DEAH box helicase family protein [Acaryochloris sp. RU_4_1]|nr:DEAD/DEAH box helicase family protein [Acaryochloris sp. RU_4_1]NJR56046.1 DEAD/DEAH box helicase family protein [Acaryochloris sp. CRU_2_0]